MNRSVLIGVFCAMSGAVTYGLNPFFAIPMYEHGIMPMSVLFYRFLIACFLLGLVMLYRQESFRLPFQYWGHVFMAGVLLALSCVFWYMTFNILDSGIGATLLFVYPVLVAFIMAIFFRERLSRVTISGIALSLLGIAMLCQPGAGARISSLGILFIFLSALTYAIYIVGVNHSRLKELTPTCLTFYAMLFALPLFLISLSGGSDLQALTTWHDVGNAFGLGLFPSMLSFLLMAVAIRHIGATQTSVLGALEPVTAVMIGMFCFGEHMSFKLMSGIVVILIAVTLVICGQNNAINLPGVKHIRRFLRYRKYRRSRKALAK